MIRPAIRFASLAAIVAAIAATAAPASAQTVEEVYVRYHAAIFAADECTDYDLIQVGEDDEDAVWKGQAQGNMGAYIDAQVGGAIGAGDRLHLIERAKGETDAYIGDHGCDDAKVQELLMVFTNELEPLLPPR
jgi:hypothetical protein